jgi:hypothetical protein
VLLAKKTQEKMLKAQEIRNEFEKAYGPVYSIVSKPEKMVKIDQTHELRVAVSRKEKNELDRILTNYPHMFPYEIVVLWRTEIRDLKISHIDSKIMSLGYGIPLKFKEKITKEYRRRLKEYFEITARKNIFGGLPDVARP